MQSFIYSVSLALATASTATAQLSCREITIPVSVSAQNKDLPSSISIASLNDTAAVNKLVAGLTSSLVTGDFNIGARYCEPTQPVASRSNTLQVLVHGITYDRDYWSGLAAPGMKDAQDQYSWIQYAANQGYPTLSVDRLCNGASSRPNGIAFCQLPLEAETMHAVIQAARQGSLPGTSKSFNKIIYAGHSYGSNVGNGLSVQHPDDVDAYLFTGYSMNLTQGEAGAAVLPLFLPAAVVSPSKFGSLLLDPTYVMASQRDGAKTVFYYGDYDPAVLQYDFDNRGTFTAGEVATGQLGQLPAPNYQGAVFVLNGNEDAIFCEAGPVQVIAGIPGDCSNGCSSGVQGSYPNARTFGFHNTANTGHCLHNHRTAQESYKAAHDFLAQAGF